MVYIESNFECSKTLPRNAEELTDKTKIRSKNRHGIPSGANYRSKFALKVRAAPIITRTFVRNETIGVMKFRRFIGAISLWANFRRKARKSQEIRRNWLALLLHNTVICGEVKTEAGKIFVEARSNLIFSHHFFCVVTFDQFRWWQVTELSWDFTCFCSWEQCQTKQSYWDE